jgi:hypothetical protein
MISSAVLALVLVVLFSSGLLMPAVASSSSSTAVASVDLTLLAEFVTVDYLWDSNHSRQLYEQSGAFVVANNIITGIKVSKAGDIFVCIPRWTSGVPASLNKLVTNPNGPGYVLSPWPSWEFNENNNSATLTYAQSMIIDSQNRMWIPDVGRTNFFDSDASLITNGPAKLFVVNVTDGAVLSTYYFPNEVVPYNNSFVNDIVLDEVNGYAYFTNTYANGGIIVYSITDNNSHMFTSVATERNSSYDFCVNGICYGTDGIGANPSDGIALSNDNKYLYFSAVQGPALYMIETQYLWDFSMTDAEFQSHVVLLGPKDGCSDGLLQLGGNLFYGDATTSQLGVINTIESSFTSANSLTASGNTLLTAESPSTLNWMDTFSLDLADSNAFYFTTNRLNLFFSYDMDFTGQSGANMRIYRATINYVSSNSSNQTYMWAAVGLGVFFVVAFGIAYALYLWRIGKFRNTNAIANANTGNINDTGTVDSALHAKLNNL